MNPVDIAILVILVAFLLKGVLRGLLKEVCSLLGLLVGGWLAFYFHPGVAQWLMDRFDLPAQLAVGIAYIALFLGAVFLFGVIGYLLSRFVSLVFLGGVNRMLGAAFGLLQGVMLLSLALYALHQPAGQRYLPDAVGQMVRRAHLAPPFIDLGQAVFYVGQKTFTR